MKLTKFGKTLVAAALIGFAGLGASSMADAQYRGDGMGGGGMGGGGPGMMGGYGGGMMGGYGPGPGSGYEEDRQQVTPTLIRARGGSSVKPAANVTGCRIRGSTAPGNGPVSSREWNSICGSATCLFPARMRSRTSMHTSSSTPTAGSEPRRLHRGGGPFRTTKRVLTAFPQSGRNR